MEKLFCKKGITISLRCLLIVASLVFGSSAWGQETTTIFSETFDKCNGTGGNDGQWSGNGVAQSTVTTDHTGWTLVKSGGAKQCVKLGSSGNAGSATTPSLSFSGDAKLSFKAAPWGTDALGLTLSITNGTLSKTSLKMVKGEWTSFEIDITGVEENSNPKITIAATKRFFLDEVKVTQTTSGGGGETELTDRELSFGATTSFDAEVGGTFSAPELTGATEGATDGVTYASSNVDVASVNASTGAVTIKGMGYAKITASAGADATYKAGSASYDIYVYGKGTIEKLKTYITSDTETDIYFNLTTTAVVTYAATNYAYMEDGHAGIYLYKKGHGLKAGNSFTGKVIAKGKLYNQLYEFTDFTPANAAGTADITATGWTIQELTDSENARYKMAESMRVKLTGVTATTSATGTSCTIEQGGASTTLALYNSLSVTAGGVYDITGYPYNNDGTWEFRVYEESCLEQKGGKTAATVTFAQESYTVETNGSITVSATKNSTSPIVYSISPADGNVSINANTGEIVAGTTTGTYTITATVAENESYTSASATCVLTVTAPAPPSYNITAPTYYKKITSTDELVLGTQYIIANIEQGQGLPASGTITTVATISEENKANITDNTLVKSEYVADFAVLTLQKDENDNYVLINEEGQYLTGANGTDLSWKDAKDTYSTWKISFDKSGNALIATTAETKSARIIMITSNSIKYYASSNNYTKVQLYQKVTDLAISTLTNGYATFVTDVPYVMPKGACGYAVTVAPHVGVITKTEAYKGGQPVPAQTALLIGGASGKYYPAVLKENVAPSYTRENYMEGKRTADGDTDSQRGGDVYYYKLALNSDGKPGFYYGKAGGAAFKLTKPTTAYLAVPQSITPVNGYLIDFDGEETGISTIAPTNGNADGAIYNLNGIRMTQTLRNLPKGVYVVNGKKVIK